MKANSNVIPSAAFPEVDRHGLHVMGGLSDRRCAIGTILDLYRQCLSLTAGKMQNDVASRLTASHLVAAVNQRIRTVRLSLELTEETIRSMDLNVVFAINELIDWPAILETLSRSNYLGDVTHSAGLQAPQVNIEGRPLRFLAKHLVTGPALQNNVCRVARR